MNKKNIHPLILLIIFFASAYSYADQVRIPVGQQAQDMTRIDMPNKGMNKEEVRTLFGSPIEEIPAKGTPPISRWKYKEFTVYFDNSTVIHSVRNFQPKEERPDNTGSTNP